MHKKIAHKLIIVIIIPIISLVGFLSAALYVQSEEAIVESRIREAESLLLLASKELVNPVYFLDIDEMNGVINDLKRDSGITNMYVMHPDGRIITDGTDDNRPYNTIIDDDFGRMSLQSEGLLTKREGDVLYLSAPITTNERIGTVTAEVSLVDLQASLGKLITTIVILAVMVGVIAVVIAIFVSRHISGPILQLKRATDEVAKGNYDVTIAATTDDEIGELAKRFEDMKKAVGATNETLNSAVKERTAELEQLYNELKRRGEELELANVRLLETDRMKDEFINIAAHELRTPILPIVLSAESLADKMPEDEHIRMILRNANRITKLTNDILDVSRIESNTFKLQKQRTNIKKMIEEVIQDAKFKIPEKRKIDFVFESTVPASMEELILDKSRITQVLVNMVDNAVNFTENGVIRVLLEPDEETHGYIRVSIIDSGSGIDPEIHDKLFGKFVSKSDRAKGTGLGLYLSKAIVEAHQGKMRGQNNSDGKGATFYFSIPAC